MKTLIAIAACLMLFVGASVPASAQCSNGSCPVVRQAAPIAPLWEFRPHIPRYGFCESHNFVYDYQEQVWAYAPGDGSNKYQWQAGPPPIEPPANPGFVQKFGDENFPTGVDTSKLRQEPKHMANGKPCDKARIFEAIERKSVDDVSGRRRVLVIGSLEERKAALEKIGKPPWAVVNAYAPNDWHVDPAKFGYVTSGSPTVYIMEPDGSVVHRQDKLEGLDLALRRADPAYDPKGDPDLRVNPVIAPGLAGVNWLHVILAAIAGAIATLFLPKKG